MKKFLLAFIAVAMFSSCSSDDAATPVNNVDITGNWIEVAYQEPETGTWQDYSCDDNIVYILRFTFNPNGTVYTSPYCEGEENEFLGSGNYTVNGDVLTVTSSGEFYTYKVSREGATTLYMQPFYTANGENVYYSKIKLTRE